MIAPSAVMTVDAQLARFPSSRYMGSKQAILPFLRCILQDLPFTTALDAFSGSAAVSYLLKSMGKSVISNDYLAFAYHTANACVANSHARLRRRPSRGSWRRTPMQATSYSARSLASTSATTRTACSIMCWRA